MIEMDGQRENSTLSAELDVDDDNDSLTVKQTSIYWMQKIENKKNKSDCY